MTLVFSIMSAPYQQKSNNTANASLTTNTSEDGQNTPAKDTIALSPFDFCEETRLYRRIDEQMIAIDPERALKNAVHGGMSGIGLVERYEVYEKEGTQDIAVVVRVGGRLCGPPGHVHGGIIATLFDNSFGWLFINAKLKGAFTANLNINYRKPIEVGTTGVIKAKITEMQVK